MSPEPEPYREDEEEEEYAPQSIFAAGWFRAVLVLTVLAIVVVVSLPYLLNWFEPAPPPLQPAQPAPSAPAPGAAARPAESPAPPPQVAEQKTPEPKAEERRPALKPARTAEPRPGAERTARAGASKASAALPPADGKRATRGDYWLQLGLFKEQSNAEALARTVRDQGFAAEVRRITRSEGSLPPGTYHLVRSGGFPDLAAASKARDALRAKGHQGFITRSNAP